MTPIQQSKAAALFVEHWTGKGYEKGESQIFWTTLLNQIFGIEHPEQFIVFEQQVLLDHTSFVDARIPSTKVMIEQKSLGKNLGEGIKQSDGSILNPFQQAKRYADTLPNSQRPRWIVTCNFAEFWVYDLEHPNDEPQKILLANLEKEYDRLQFLVDQGNDHIKQEMTISVEAGQLVAQMYDQLLAQYIDKDSPETLRSLNILCVRLVFCLYAEDAHLFGKKTAFHDYLARYEARDIRRALLDLFAVLDTPLNERDPYMDDVLKAFPYVNGGLFSNDTRLIIPQFTDELKELLLAKASDDFDWVDISPTIFGAVFESTLNPETRRSGGMHYTSIENIHKVIDPLFLDALRDEFETIKAIPQEKLQCQKLDAFQDKLANLTFFDPACGSGNFLTESYVSLRRLENEVIALRNKGQAVIGEFANPTKVDIHQFYGIEINDFAVSVATTAVWNASTKQIEQQTMYYVSGLPMNNSTEDNLQAYKYNNKELIAQFGLNEYDSEARYYYPAIGRTTTMDPLAEDYYHISPYAWCGNNWVNVIDLSGEAPVTPAPKEIMGGPYYYYYRNKDYASRHQGIDNDYYKNYGEKYNAKFKFQTKPKLSPLGQKWVDEVALNLQIALENRLKKEDGTEFEASTDFNSYAYKTHVEAYKNENKEGETTPLCVLPLKDVWLIARTPELQDSFGSIQGLKQILQIGAFLVISYSQQAIDEIQDLYEDIKKQMKDYFDTVFKTNPL